MKLKDKVVLVTGGAGFIGSHLVDRCLKEGAHKVISYDNLIGGTLENHEQLKHEPRFHFVNGSICDKELLSRYVNISDVIFNEAASKLVVSLKNPGTDVETNVVGNFNLLETIKNSGSNPRVIHASTVSVFGSSDTDFSEDDVKRPSTVYGVSKLAAEGYFTFYNKEYGIKSSILRYCHVFGPRQEYQSDAGVISIFLSKVLNGEPPVIYSGGEQIRCFTYVQDIIDANFLLLADESTIGQTYNVASKTRMSISHLADTVIRHYSKNPLMKPIQGNWRIGENIRPIPNTSKIEQIGFNEKTSFMDGLEKTKEYVERTMYSRISKQNI